MFCKGSLGDSSTVTVQAAIWEAPKWMVLVESLFRFLESVEELKIEPRSVI